MWWSRDKHDEHDRAGDQMHPFFGERYTDLVESPNGSPMWWHSVPLPNGARISGFHEDKQIQQDMWRALRIPEGGLAGKSVLDVGANDGFFTIAALLSGAASVTAVDLDWEAWPGNIQYVCDQWQLTPEILSADFRTYDFGRRYDVIFFLGVLYHLEDVFGATKRLRELLTDDGVMYVETQMTLAQSELPIFESASDCFPTVARQYKQALSGVGQSNYLMPNEAAVRNLAFSYDFECESLRGPENVYSDRYPTRQMYKFTTVAEASLEGFPGPA
jgi:SAM-dependent methyltransferase